MPRVAYKPLSEAVYKRDAKLLASLAADDPAAAQHWKPITDAAFVGSVDCVNVLVEHGADVNVRSGTGSKHTPLTRLCQYHTTIPKHDGHKETLDRLLEVGADPTVAAGPLGLTPLCYAAMGPLEDLVASLIGEVRPLDVFSAALLYDLRRLKQHAKKKGLATVDQEQRSLVPLFLVKVSRKQAGDMMEHDGRYGGQAGETSGTGGEPLVERRIDASLEVVQPPVVLRCGSYGGKQLAPDPCEAEPVAVPCAFIGYGR